MATLALKYTLLNTGGNYNKKSILARANEGKRESMKLNNDLHVLYCRREYFKLSALHLKTNKYEFYNTVPKFGKWPVFFL